MPIKQNFLDTIERLVKDTAGRTKPEDREMALSSALEQYSLDKPLWLSVDVVGNGTSDIPVSSLTSFDDRFAQDIKIEYPISTSYPTAMPRSSWLWYVKPTGKVIRLLGAAPTALESIRLTYRAFYTVHESDEDLTTVWGADYYAFCKLAASHVDDLLAQEYSQSEENNILSADMSAYRTKSQEYRTLARQYREQYEKHIKAHMQGPMTLVVSGQGANEDYLLDELYS